MTLDFGDCGDCVHNGICKFCCPGGDSIESGLDDILGCMHYGSYCASGNTSQVYHMPPLSIVSLMVKGVILSDGAVRAIQVNKLNKEFDGIDNISIKVKGEIISVPVYHNMSLGMHLIRVIRAKGDNNV